MMYFGSFSFGLAVLMHHPPSMVSGLASRSRGSTLPFVASRPRSSLAVSRNPNDEETPEERQQRMENVRRIQANFYQPDDTSATSILVDGAIDENSSGERWLERDPHDASVIRNLPLWRVQWTELPGYQNVLNVHVAHYTHMFRKLVLQHPRPWYFGHVHLPGGSENLANSDYFLPQDGEDSKNAARGRVPTVGTLMQVTDYVEQEDGRLTLVVQGVERVKILAAAQQVPYAVASKAKVLPDLESWEPYYDGLMGTDEATHDLSATYEGAAKALAAKESDLLRTLDYFPAVMKRHTTADGAMMVSEVSPLSNVNGSASMDLDELESHLQGALTASLSKKAKDCGRKDILLVSEAFQLSNVTSSGEQEVLALERDVWIRLDKMIKLIGEAQPGVKVPVPAQLLGLLPIDADWPAAFRLQEYADQLQANRANIGTYSKSPFVRLSAVYPDYPPIRRASRLSYTVWLLIESIAGVGGGFDREEYLNTLSIRQRLKKTRQCLDQINKAVETLI